MRSSLALVIAAAVATGCGDDPAGPPDVFFDLDGELAGRTFFDAPFPSDVRVDADGTQAYGGFPNPNGGILIRQLVGLADAKVGAPLMPIAFFRFAAPTAPWQAGELIAPAPTAPIMLLDVDPDSPDRGRLYPVVAEALIFDGFAPEHLLAVAPYPGIVLAPSTTYAVVVRSAAAPGLRPAAAIATMAAGDTPAGARGAATAAAYAPLWPTLASLGVASDDVLTATVFTTGDPTALLFARSEAVRAAHDAVIADLAIDGDGDHRDPVSPFCELVGTVTFPQFQRGAAPFTTEGDFVLDAAGTPIAQGSLTVPLTITIPAGPMPTAGWPLYQFFHGSGGVSGGVVDLGKTLLPDGEPEVGKGPAFVVARYGLATVSAALPVNPERLPGASDYAYLNLQNLAAFPFTFQQGVFEQRLLLDALLALRIPANVVAGCTGAANTEHRFDAAKLVAGGQSMGGMYTNLFGAVEPRVPVLVPTGAGGFWNLMILETGLIRNTRDLLGGIFETAPDELTFAHPGMSLLGSGWEIAEPLVAMSRLARRPLPGHPVRHVYQPVGKDDVYFPTTVYDAAALAYGNRQAGPSAWPAMQQSLALDELDGVVSYPVARNQAGPGGAMTTRVVVQFESDGIVDSHYIYRQLEEVKHQYGCFFDSYLRTGTPTVVAPAPLTAPCQ
jgi:hypothetical protein